jgi:hypothetical protein
MSIADAKVGLTASDREKSPLWTVLWMMSLWFTATTRWMGSPIFCAMHPAWDNTEEQYFRKKKKFNWASSKLRNFCIV